MIAYHFTSVIHVPLIFATGTLKRTESNVSGRAPRLGPDVVWLLDSPDLTFGHGIDEAAMRRSLGFGVPDAGRPDKTEVRFTVEAPEKWTVRWKDWAPLHVEPDWADVLVKLAGGWEATEHWLISFARIPRARWLEVANVHTGHVYTDEQMDAFAGATVPTPAHLS